MDRIFILPPVQLLIPSPQPRPPEWPSWHFAHESFPLNGEVNLSTFPHLCVYNLGSQSRPAINTINTSVQFSPSVVSLCDPMNRSTPGLPVHHHLPEFTQTHVHRVGDAISSSVFPFSSCPQSLPASESFPMSQLFV